MTKFRLVDIFHTIQGEGFNAGRRALFIRLPFCNLKCSWCDTEFNSFNEYTREQIKEIILQEPCRLAIITGGEPLMNKQAPAVVTLLKEYNFQIACETNGSFPYVDGIDWVTVSPKRDNDFEIHSQLIDHVKEVKIVIDEVFDMTLLKEFENIRPAVKLYLSPEWTNFDKNVEKIVAYQKENPQWIISLQTHKILKVK